jgi:hypothetical protein
VATSEYTAALVIFMKHPITTHLESLANLNGSISRKEIYLQSLQEELNECIEKRNYLAEQIKQAILKGVNEFDRDKYEVELLEFRSKGVSGTITI